MISKKSTKKSSVEKEPQSMDQLLKLYGQSFYAFSPRDRVKGKIISIDDQRVLVDIGAKSEGLIAEKAYKEAEKLIKKLKPGDEIEARVIVPETSDGYTILTLREAVEKDLWERVKENFEKGGEIFVKGKGVSSSGVTVQIDNLTGFIPISQLGKKVVQNPSSLIGRQFPVRVIDFNVPNKKVILSEKEVSEADDLKKVREAVKKVKENEVYDGEVTSVYDFGCFVKIDTGETKEKISLEGLVHISELSWDKIDSTSDILSVGAKVKVKVIGKKDDKLAFSIKQAQKDPWEEMDKKYKKDARLKGKVVKLTDFGAFVMLEPGIEGLIHMTKIPPGKKLAKGEEINVYVEDIDTKARKISLGLVLTEKPIGYK